MDPNGHRLANLTAASNGDDVAPNWRADGRRIAFMSNRVTAANPEGDFEIFVMSAAGSHPVQLTSNGLDDEDPAWSPDGCWISFQRDFDPVEGEVDHDLFTMRADGTGQRNLTNSPGVQDNEPGWSANGRTIAFVSDRDGDPEIFSMRPDGSNVRQLTFNDALDFRPDWSPDSRMIGFASDQDGDFEVFTMRADGTRQRNLTDDDAGDGVMAWSPDGRKIVFNSDRAAGDPDVFTMHADGSRQVNRTENPAFDFAPDWQPLRDDRHGPGTPASGPSSRRPRRRGRAGARRRRVLAALLRLTRDPASEEGENRGSMPTRHWLLAVAPALATLALVPAPASASTISGKVVGPKPPKAGQGLTTVRAVRARDLVIVRLAKVRSRRFRIKVPAGRYWVFAATTRFRGKAGIDRPVGKVIRLRAGKAKRLRAVSLRRSRKRARAAQFAFVNVTHPAAWVQHFTVSGPPDRNVLRKGLAQMLITDLLPVIKSTCDGAIVEREHIDRVMAEILRSQSPAFDPSTRLSSDKLIAHNREVTGTLKVEGATTTLNVVVTNAVTGTSRSVTRSAPNDRFFELEKSVVQEVARLICGDNPPGHYAGPASGSLSGASGSSSQTLSWNGDVRLRFTGDVVPENSGDPPGEYAIYEPESGGIHVILDGVDGECAYHGTSDVTIVPHPGEHSRVQQGVDQPTYSLFATLPGRHPTALRDGHRTRPLRRWRHGDVPAGRTCLPRHGRRCFPARVVGDVGGHRDVPARARDHELELVARARGGLAVVVRQHGYCRP